MSDETLQQLARALQDVMAMGQKASGSPISPSNLYGKTGLFGRCDGPSTLVNAMVGPYGVESILDWVGNNTENEFVDTIKGISEEGSEQSAVCGDCVKVCPVDAIIVTAAPPQIPAPLVDQLKDGGRMIVPVGTWFQELVLLTKEKGKVEKKTLIPVRFVPMTGKIQKIKEK